MFFWIYISSCKYCDFVILKGSWKCTFEQFYAFYMHTQFGNRLEKGWFCGSNDNERNEFCMRKWIKDFPIIAYCPVYYTIYLILPRAELYLYASNPRNIIENALQIKQTICIYSICDSRAINNCFIKYIVFCNILNVGFKAIAFYWIM